MTFWIPASLLAFGVAGALLFVLLRTAPRPEGSAAAIYEDQLSEVERDEARGVLTPAAAKEARAEIERRLLDAMRRGTFDGRAQHLDGPDGFFLGGQA